MMDINKMVELFAKKVPKEQILVQEPMKKHTTFRIGGPADILVKPENKEQLSEILQVCQKEKIPYYILGNGSNLLVSDLGYRGVIIQLYNQFADITVKGNQITAQSGALLSRIASQALENTLAGFEFAHGIPGTLGGAVVMNAGAYGGELKDVIVSCEVMTPEGKILTLFKDELELGYRTSIIQKKGYIVLEATIALEKGDVTKIQELMKDYAGRRRDKQPLDKPSAGSTFKRPTGHFAGKLIMDSDLRGFRVGDAMVSDKHCGFVVNVGEATAEEILQLIAEVKRIVKEKFDVELEPEIKMLGF